MLSEDDRYPAYVRTGDVIDIYVKLRMDTFHSGLHREVPGALFLKINDLPQNEAYAPVSLSIEISGRPGILARMLSFSPSNVRVHRSGGAASPRTSRSITNV